MDKPNKEVLFLIFVAVAVTSILAISYLHVDQVSMNKGGGGYTSQNLSENVEITLPNLFYTNEPNEIQINFGDYRTNQIQIILYDGNKRVLSKNVSGAEGAGVGVVNLTYHPNSDRFIEGNKTLKFKFKSSGGQNLDLKHEVIKRAHYSRTVTRNFSTVVVPLPPKLYEYVADSHADAIEARNAYLAMNVSDSDVYIVFTDYNLTPGRHKITGYPYPQEENIGTKLHICLYGLHETYVTDERLVGVEEESFISEFNHGTVVEMTADVEGMGNHSELYRVMPQVEDGRRETIIGLGENDLQIGENMKVEALVLNTPIVQRIFRDVYGIESDQQIYIYLRDVEQES